MIKRFLSLSVLLAMLWGCCTVEDIPATEEKTASYKVEHYQQNTDDGYTLVEADSENKNGKAGENTSVQAKTYEGFTAKTVEQVKITADGKAVVKIYYDRNEITLTLDLDGGEGENEIIGKYGATVNVTAPTKSGYDFASWNPQLPKTFPAISTTYKATWTVGNGTAYKVEHYQQNITDDEYTLADTENKTGTTDADTSAQAKTYDGFTAKTIEQVKITADGSAVVKIYYDRNEITLTLNLDGGEGENEIIGKYGATVNVTTPTKSGYQFTGWNPELPTTFPAESATYTAKWAKEGDYVITYKLNGGTNASDNPASYNVENATITLADATKTGYTFGGWYTDEACTETNKVTEIKTGSTGNLTLYAKWNANTDTAYKVEHYQQNIADDGYTLVNADTENKTGVTDETTTATAKDYAGFTAKTVEQVKITADGKAVVKIYYDRNTITLTLNLDDGEGETEITGKYGAIVTTPANPTKTGYTFADWNPSLPATLTGNATYTATWTASTDTAYKVEHYQQNITDDEYTLADTENKTGTTDEETSAQAKTYEGFTAKTVEQVKIAADGSAVVKIYYDRNIITLTLDPDGDEGETEITGKYGATVNVTAPTKSGYEFAGWSPELPATFPTESATYTAQWAKLYTITYNLNGGSWKSGFTPVTVRNVNTGVALPTYKNITKTGYKLSGWYTDETFSGEKIEIIPSGTTADIILYAKYEDCYVVTAEDVPQTIAGLAAGGPYNILVTGTLTSDTISAIKTALGNNRYAKVNLDLSDTTGLTSIGGSAFRNCSSLESIVIPDSVTSIGDSAFFGCSKLTSVVIPDSVTSIGSSAFQACSKLTSVVIPDSVTSIGSSAFQACSSLTNLRVDTNNPNYSSSDDGKILYNKGKTKLIAYPSATGDVTIPDSVTSIDDYAFYGCSSLTSVVIGNGVTSIGDDAFYGCSSLTSVVIGNGVTSIGDDAFFYCRSLTSVTIPDSVTSIGSSAFYSCSSLRSVVIGNGVTSIGRNAFIGCSSLRSVVIGNGVTSIDDNAFKDCSSLTTVNYKGTQEQWGQISIGNSNSYLTNATINYNYSGE